MVISFRHKGLETFFKTGKTPGKRNDICSVRVSGNGRVTFRFNGENAEIVNDEDYHRGDNMLMHKPPHSGEIIKELCLAPLELSVTAAAEALGVSRKHHPAL